MYAYGHGVSETCLKLKTFQYAAQQGNPQAQLGLGTLYRLGLGVQLDYRKAIQWYRRSASHGDSDAMNNLGYMFSTVWVSFLMWKPPCIGSGSRRLSIIL